MQITEKDLKCIIDAVLERSHKTTVTRSIRLTPNAAKFLTGGGFLRANRTYTVTANGTTQ